MKATITSLLLSLIAITSLNAADDFYVKGVHFRGYVQKLSEDGTTAYVTDIYNGSWWELVSNLDAASRAKLGVATTDDKVALAEERVRVAEEKAAAAESKAQRQTDYLRRLKIVEAEERANAAMLASEQAARDAIAAQKAADPRAIATAKRIEQARIAYQQQLQAQELQIFNALIEVQQIEVLRRLGYLK